MISVLVPQKRLTDLFFQITGFTDEFESLDSYQTDENRLNAAVSDELKNINY